MKRKLLGGAALLMAAFSLNEANATSCAVPPTCAQLGYTMKKADCGDMPIMRCPFAVSDDNQVYCEGTVKVAALPILYGDGTVSKKLISGKTPIGIVFDETNRLAVALTDVKKDGSTGSEAMMWSDEQIDTPLENCSSFAKDLKTCDSDGRKNTDILLKITTGNYDAVKAVNKYKPSGCTVAICNEGKWFLPSVMELGYIYKVFSQISYTVTYFLNKGEPLIKYRYWSSNEYSATNAFTFNMADGDWPNPSKGVVGNGNIVRYYVRPVVKY